MDKRRIVVGRHTEEKRDAARHLRSEMTPAELILWARLRRGQICGARFRRQQVIDGFIVDFYCHSSGLVVELDGSVHDRQAEYDSERSAIIQRRGLTVIRFTNDRVLTETDSVLEEIAAGLAPPSRRRLADPPVRACPREPQGRGPGG